MPEKSIRRCLFEIVNHTLDDILTYTWSRSRYKEDNFQDDLCRDTTLHRWKFASHYGLCFCKMRHTFVFQSHLH